MQNQRVLITGGAGLIGSHIADLLVERDVQEIVVLDNFVRGRRDNLVTPCPTDMSPSWKVTFATARSLPRSWRASIWSSIRPRFVSRNARKIPGWRWKFSSTAPSMSPTRP